MLVPAEQPHMIGAYLGSDGSCYEAIKIPAGGTREALSPEALLERRNLIRIQERRTAFKRAVKMMADAGKRAIDQAGLTVDNITWWIPHQANLRIIRECGKELGIPEARTIIVIEHCANSSSASIPIALAKAVHAGKIRRGEFLLLTSVGAGMIHAGVVFRW